MEWSKRECEYLRLQAKGKFDQCRETWIECGKWAAPHRIKTMLSQTRGARNNYHVVDPTHILAHRSFVSGFLEGNTSASRPWFRIEAGDPSKTNAPQNKEWLDIYSRRCHDALSTSNFYHAAGQNYFDLGVVNTGAHFIEKIGKSAHFHTLEPGTYFVINNSLGEAVILVREFSLTVKAVVGAYGKRNKSGTAMWDNFSPRVKKLYEEGNYSDMVDIVTVIRENEHYNPDHPQVLLNRRWIMQTYEVATSTSTAYNVGQNFGIIPDGNQTSDGDKVFLSVEASKRKPFIVSKTGQSSAFEYGEDGPTLTALGIIKSLNKKAISGDQALEQMLRPATQGPANLRKSYISTAPGSYVPVDATSMQAGKGLRPIFEVNPGIGALVANVEDLRKIVDKIYFADYLMFLSRNPKTRTATETNAVVQEQQLVIGPTLQTLNWTYNVPVVNFIMDFVLFEDEFLPPPPPDLRGTFLQTKFISVFAQSMKAADLPAIERVLAFAEQVGQLNPQIWQKVNLDKIADLYEDRLFLPAGVITPQTKVDAMREQQQAMAQRQQMMHETLPALAGAAKDASSAQKPA